MRCSLAFTLAALWALAGCGGDAGAARDGGLAIYDGSGGFGASGGSGGFGGGGPGFGDRDADGLCDATEDAIGSNSDTFDTDGDGLPDVIELLYGFAPTDPLSPPDDRVARIEARAGAEARLPIRFTVDGENDDFVGFFEDAAALYEDASSAGLYLESSVAIGAEPPEAARVVDGPRQRFLSVLGTARLELEVRFIAPENEDAEGCARAYPFRYGIRQDGRGVVSDRLYLLVVAPNGGGEPEDFCKPVDCL